MLKINKIAIIGATSHIACGLIELFSKRGDVKLFLFARSPEKIDHFIKENKIEFVNIIINDFKDFKNNEYDTVINCIGLGDPTKIKNILKDHFRLTEFFDNLILDYLNEHKDTMYINMGSAAVYGTDFEQPVDSKSNSILPINNITPDKYYSIAKINAEAKHRAFSEFSIVDLRIFTYFSRYIDLNSGYLITEIINSIKDDKTFITDNINVVRDYINPIELYNIICCCMDHNGINDVFDVYSAKPIKKFELLDFFKINYNLNYCIVDDQNLSSATGRKMNYFSVNKKAAIIGYEPKFTSIRMISEEVKKILK